MTRRAFGMSCLPRRKPPISRLKAYGKPIFPFRPALNRMSMRWSRASRRTRRTILTVPPRCGAYLRSAYSYTLDQNIPPTGRDFVSWFLLTERQGYCTSFASAMAVMARIAGLPSRYIEGYAAVPDSDGTARVTQRNAHAWTEIYFSGFGWLSFDATPGYGTENTSDDGNLPITRLPRRRRPARRPRPMRPLLHRLLRM